MRLFRFLSFFQWKAPKSPNKQALTCERSRSGGWQWQQQHQDFSVAAAAIS
jgi:hypothetical protein